MNSNNWITQEFSEVDFKDKRLNKRLLNMAHKFDERPESSIPIVFGSWAKTKAVYRFFDNPKVTDEVILYPHTQQALRRMKKEDIVLVIQDTSFFTYGNHKKTKGLGRITGARKALGQVTDTMGLIMHTAYAIKPNGVPLGILDQRIFARENHLFDMPELHNTAIRKRLPIELKESIKWIKPIEYISGIVPSSYKCKIIHVCDREGDFFDLFLAAKENQTSILVRAESDRIIGKPSRSVKNKNLKLFQVAKSSPILGSIQIELKDADNQQKRIVELSIRSGHFELFPNRYHPKASCNIIPKLNLNFVYVLDENPHSQTDAIEWLLITDLPIENLEQAVEKVKWYQKRWQIESFHKILKSGFKVENCRMSEGKRLIKYLTLMSILSWKIQWLTWAFRENLECPANEVLSEDEITVLSDFFNKKSSNKENNLTASESIILIARLGGFLNRKNDGFPGSITIWRGWFRLNDMVVGYSQLNSKNTYG